MITNNDRKVLQKTTGKYFFWVLNIAMPLVLIIFTATGILNILLAKRFAAFDGMTLGQFIGSWADGVALDVQYSGAYLKANERWITALLQLTLGYCFILPIWIWKNFEISRNRRILKHIESKESESGPRD